MAKEAVAQCDLCKAPITNYSLQKKRDGMKVCKKCADIYWTVPRRPRKKRKR